MVILKEKKKKKEEKQKKRGKESKEKKKKKEKKEKKEKIRQVKRGRRRKGVKQQPLSGVQNIKAGWDLSVRAAEGESFYSEIPMSKGGGGEPDGKKINQGNQEAIPLEAEGSKRRNTLRIRGMFEEPNADDSLKFGNNQVLGKELEQSLARTRVYRSRSSRREA